jgi:hypothetical protein
MVNEIIECSSDGFIFDFLNKVVFSRGFILKVIAINYFRIIFDLFTSIDSFKFFYIHKEFNKSNHKNNKKVENENKNPASNNLRKFRSNIIS